MDGTAKDCNKYHKVESGDGCQDLAKEYGIALDVVGFLSARDTYVLTCAEVYLLESWRWR